MTMDYNGAARPVGTQSAGNTPQSNVAGTNNSEIDNLRRSMQMQLSRITQELNNVTAESERMRQQYEEELDSVYAQLENSSNQSDSGDVEYDMEGNLVRKSGQRNTQVPSSRAARKAARQQQEAAAYYGNLEAQNRALVSVTEALMKYRLNFGDPNIDWAEDELNPEQWAKRVILSIPNAVQARAELRRNVTQNPGNNSGATNMNNQSVEDNGAVIDAAVPGAMTSTDSVAARLQRGELSKEEFDKYWKKLKSYSPIDGRTSLLKVEDVL